MSGAYVYVLMQKGKAVYVGATTNFHLRMGVHSKQKKFDRVFVLEVAIENLFQVEAEWIAALCPQQKNLRKRLDTPQDFMAHARESRWKLKPSIEL